MREEVLHEVRGADGALIGAVTRNRMGVEVLNTDVLLVADVDLPPQRKLFRTGQPDPRPALERIARWAAAHRPRCAHLSHRSRPARHHHRAGERASRPDGPRRPRLGRSLRAAVRTARDLAGPADAEAHRVGRPRIRASWPYLGDAQRIAEKWLRDYERGCAHRAVCELLSVTGHAPDGDAAVLVDLHDRATQATSGQQLA